jgi:hypothetical protein
VQVLWLSNADYADYHLFVCEKEAKFVRADIHDKAFEGKCPSDGSDLMEITELPSDKCLRCNHASLVTKETRPIQEGSNTLP